MIFPGTEVKVPGLQLLDLSLLILSDDGCNICLFPAISVLYSLESLEASQINEIHSFSYSLCPCGKKFAAKHTHIHIFNKVNFLEIIARTATWELPTYNRESNIRETVCLQAWIQHTR